MDLVLRQARIIRYLSCAIIGVMLSAGCEKSDGPDMDKVGRSESQRADSPTFSEPGYVVADPTPTELLTGINGGERFQFYPADFSGEWLRGNGDLVRFFILEKNGTKNVSVAAENFYLRTKDDVLFFLDADFSGGNGSSSYSLIDRNLALAMNSEIEVVLELDGKSYLARLSDGAESETDSPESVED